MTEYAGLKEYKFGHDNTICSLDLWKYIIQPVSGNLITCSKSDEITLEIKY